MQKVVLESTIIIQKNEYMYTYNDKGVQCIRMSILVFSPIFLSSNSFISHLLWSIFCSSPTYILGGLS